MSRPALTLACFVVASLGAADARAQRSPTRPASAADAPAPPTDDASEISLRPRVRTPKSPPREVTQPQNKPSLSWVLAQLVPSPGFWIGPAHDVPVERLRDIVEGQPPPADVAPGQRVFHHRGGIPRVSLAWQVTPVLYSFGVNRRISPWRTLVIDPYARNSGSIELHFSPEWVPGATDTHLFYRTGFRTTLPVLQHGEYLSVMVGASYSRYEGRGGIVYEAGVSVLSGAVGLVFSHSPAFPDLRYGVRLNLKYF